MKKVRKYTSEFKQEAVRLALKSPSITGTANELGIPMPTLHSWLSQLKNKVNSAVKTSDGDKNKDDIAALLEENRRLHKELAIAKEEKEILKKAATYFAQHQK